jgi:hypothetical protein
LLKKFLRISHWENSLTYIFIGNNEGMKVKFTPKFIKIILRLPYPLNERKMIVRNLVKPSQKKVFSKSCFSFKACIIKLFCHLHPLSVKDVFKPSNLGSLVKCKTAALPLLAIVHTTSGFWYFHPLSVVALELEIIGQM